MKDTINILGVKIDCITGKNAMVQAIEFIENGSADTIEILTMEVLMNELENSQWKQQVSRMKLVLPGEAEILETAEINDKKLLKEADTGLFPRLFMKYLQKNRKKLFVLAQSQDMLDAAVSTLKKYNRGVRISGYALLSSDESREEDVVNEINGTETDCILSVLPSPYQESFISRNRALLNTNVWFGCGALLVKKRNRQGILGKMRHIVVKSLFRHRVAKEYNEENIR